MTVRTPRSAARRAATLAILCGALLGVGGCAEPTPAPARCTCPKGDASTPAPRGATTPAATAPRGAGDALHRAVALAWDKLKAIGRAPGDYRLVGVQLLYRRQADLWRITFKPKRLIPADPTRQPVGAGGEVFVNVDLKSGVLEVRYGE